MTDMQILSSCQNGNPVGEGGGTVDGGGGGGGTAVVVVDVVEVVVVVVCPGVFGVFLHSFSNRQRHTQKTRMLTLLIKISPLSQKNPFLIYNKFYLFVNHISLFPTLVITNIESLHEIFSGEYCAYQKAAHLKSIKKIGEMIP